MSTETSDQARRVTGEVSGAKPQNRKYKNVETGIAGNLRDAVNLITLGAERVYVIGAAPGADECADLAAECGGIAYLDGHWPTLRLFGASIRWAAQWTGSEEAGIEETRRIFAEISDEIRRTFGSSAVMLATPATTGRDLWLRVAGEQWPVMSAPSQDRVRATASQGRIELFAPGAGLQAEHIYEYDMRVAYSAVMRELPIGEPVELGASAGRHLAEESPYARARYRLSWKAPAAWDHVGILPADGDPRSWPLAGSGWADGAEVRLARQYRWTVTIHEAMIWERSGDPLTRWGNRITERINAAESAGNRPLRHAWRAMLLQAIGAFHGAPRRHTVIGEDPPAGAQNLRMLPGGRLAWTERRPAAWPALSHPEWSSSIWSRTRARLLSGPNGTGMLNLDPRTIIACRTDAIYTTTDRASAWSDDGKAGRFRLKGHTFASGRAWPRSSAELLREAHT